MGPSNDRPLTQIDILEAVAWESPWVKYEKIYNTELGGLVGVAVRETPLIELVHMRAFATHAAEETLHVYGQLQHRNIVTALEVFTIDSGFYIVLEEGFKHRSLTCSNILLNTAANQEFCQVISKSKGTPNDFSAFSSIKYVKEDGAIGVDNLQRWPSNLGAVGFLSATTSTASTAELLKHPLLCRSWQKESLIGIISLAQVYIRGQYKYTPRVSL
ncbi:hypothetical protein BKA64DRAFT_698219 [Cadophora sp. MPI-SDFR-AT-0126]|nr:hypothetical protein BKA64DRAFT_698219 [Leotiomycetes sp. MPI-SDFR-AT-0126]